MNDVVPPTQAIFQAMQDVLSSINSAFEAEGVVLPDRQYVMIGEAAHDCEQLTVSFDQLFLGGPGDEITTPLRCEAARTIALSVQLVRCVPAITRQGPPTAEQLTETTERLTQDSWLLLEGCINSIPANYLGALVDVTVTAPDGKFQAVQANLTVGVP